jgi:hypothetical protein
MAFTVTALAMETDMAAMGTGTETMDIQIFAALKDCEITMEQEIRQV